MNKTTSANFIYVHFSYSSTAVCVILFPALPSLWLNDSSNNDNNNNDNNNNNNDNNNNDNNNNNNNNDNNNKNINNK